MGAGAAEVSGRAAGPDTSTSWRDGLVVLRGGLRMVYIVYTGGPAPFLPVLTRKTLMRSLRTLLAVLAVAGALACGQTPVASNRTAPDPRMDGGPYLGGGNAVDSTHAGGSTNSGPASGPFLGGGN